MTFIIEKNHAATKVTLHIHPQLVSQLVFSFMTLGTMLPLLS
jgi:hypothetical protein